MQHSELSLAIVSLHRQSFVLVLIYVAQVRKLITNVHSCDITRVL